MGARQPVGQQGRGFVRRLAVEGHQRRGQAWNPHDLRTPSAVGDARDFNHVLAAGDDGIETL